MHLLRPRAPAHRQPRSSTADTDAEKPDAATPVANPQIVYDRPIQLYTTFLAAGIYAIAVLISLYTWLPSYMIVHFDAIRSFDRAHQAALVSIAPFLLPIGYAAHAFMFTPSVAARANLATAKSKAFNPATASLGETIRWNLGLDGAQAAGERLRVLAGRTAVVALFGGTNLAVRTWAAVAGADLIGAAAWATVWSTAAVVTGLIYAWIGDV